MKFLAALLDADGCLYNLDYARRLIFIIHKYRQALTELAAEKALDSNQQSRIAELEKQILAEVTGEGWSQQAELYSKIEILVLHDHIESKEPGFEWSIFSDSQQMMKCLMRLISIYRPLMDKVIGKHLQEKIFLDANKALVDMICLGVEKQDFTTLFLMIASSRQSKELDDMGIEAYGSGPIAYDIQVLCAEINRRLVLLGKGNRCKVETILMPDLYENRPIGETFKKMMLAHEAKLAGEKIPTIEHPEYRYYDDTKFTIVYAFLHYLWRELMLNGVDVAEATLEAFFLDDRLDIHDALLEVLWQHCDLLPSNVSLAMLAYTGQFAHDAAGFINGTGEIDPNFKATVRKMAESCEPTKSGSINVARDLDFYELKRTVLARQDSFASSVSILFKSRDVTSMSDATTMTEVPKVGPR